MIRRKIGIFLAIWILLLWTIRIVNVNRSDGVINQEISMQQTFYSGGLSITPTESHLYTITEFQKVMDTEVETEQDNAYIVCVKFQVMNKTGEVLDWDEIMDRMGYGFETLTWYSAYEPFLGAKTNHFSTENLGHNEEADVWFVTQVRKECFKEKNWGKIDEQEFYYVMDVYPNPVKVKLEIREEG